VVKFSNDGKNSQGVEIPEEKEGHSKSNLFK